MAVGCVSFNCLPLLTVAICCSGRGSPAEESSSENPHVLIKQADKEDEGLKCEDLVLIGCFW